ncbi:MAG: hypothetical protein MZV70_39800 [Desulfobacterales bacterium]|nr:hypothetical protein [Desulfobacterales bacterium]
MHRQLIALFALTLAGCGVEVAGTAATVGAARVEEARQCAADQGAVRTAPGCHDAGRAATARGRGRRRPGSHRLPTDPDGSGFDPAMHCLRSPIRTPGLVAMLAVAGCRR